MDDFASGRPLARIETESLADCCKHLHMSLGLLQVLRPFFAQVLIDRTFEGGLINKNTALLVLKGLQEKFFHLGFVHFPVLIIKCAVDLFHGRSADAWPMPRQTAPPRP